MADFRRWFIALAVVALMAGLASAQVGSIPNGGGSAGNALICTATGAGIPELRPEGYTELVGDILITCQGGPDLRVGSLIPTTNITVYTSPGVPITSRYLNSNGASEALLIIDEAGGNVSTGAQANQGLASGTGYGPAAPQVLCAYGTSAGQQQYINPTTGAPGCAAYVGTDGTGNYEVAVTGPPGSANNAQNIAAANVYQGKIGDFCCSNNNVTFYNVPVLPPATGGVTRVFRITNIRVPVPGGGITSTLNAIISTSPSAALPLSGTAIEIGIVGKAMSASVATPKAFQQCVPQGPGSLTVALTTTLTYTEGFATGFKTRVVPGGNLNNSGGNPDVAWNAERTNTASPTNQNIPGSTYGQFSANSESGFIFPGLSNSTYTAGLADFGTRLKAVFYNLPSGVNLYVSQTSTGSGTNSVPVNIGGTSEIPYAVLVGGITGEGTADSFSTTGNTFLSELAQSQNNKSNILGSDGLAAVQLVGNSSNQYEAVWEVTNANPNKVDVLSFSVYISYTPASATTANPYGTPIAPVFPPGLPGLVPNDVQLSLAPEPSFGAIFTTTTGPVGSTNPIPRFITVATYEGPFVNINLCQTTLLYPYVTSANGFDTGIAVANTTQDPFGTVTQSGSCSLYAYGVSVGATGNTPFNTTGTPPAPPKGGNIPGCDLISSGTPYYTCFPVVQYGQVQTVQAMNTLPNFYGYVIAICNFQLAHGYASVSDTGLRNLWTSYLALELSASQTLSCSTTGCTGSITIGSPRANVQSIESLAH